MNQSDPPRAAYLHVPFCARRCGYCNFTVVAGREDLVDDYLRAIELELAVLKTPRPVDTLYIGGGTPTQLPPPALAQLLDIATLWFPLGEDAEFTVEANPADVDLPRVQALAAAGVNRISLGAQSLDSAKLRVLQRDHTPEDVAIAVELLRPCMTSLALDLIFTAPGESPDDWRRDLAAMLQLRPDHVSTYGLSFDKGSAFYGRLLRGALSRCAEEDERAMYVSAIETLGEAGLAQYEVSNFARTGHRSRHNAMYWTGASYYAAGPGAARYVNGRREMNHRSTTTYLKRVLAGESPVAEREELSPENRARELLVFALRRIKGVDRQWFHERAGFTIDQLIAEPLRRFVEQGLLADTARGIRLTREGLLVSDSLWPEMLRI